MFFFDFSRFFHFFVQKGRVSFEIGVKIGCVLKNRAFLGGVLFFCNVVVFGNIDVVLLRHLREVTCRDGREHGGGVRSQESVVRSQESEVRSQESGVRSQWFY